MASAPSLTTDLSSLEFSAEPGEATRSDEPNLNLALYAMALVAVAIFMFDLSLIHI